MMKESLWVELRTVIGRGNRKTWTTHCQRVIIVEKFCCCNVVKGQGVEWEQIVHLCRCCDIMLTLVRGILLLLLVFMKIV